MVFVLKKTLYLKAFKDKKKNILKKYKNILA